MNESIRDYLQSIWQEARAERIDSIADLAKEALKMLDELENEKDTVEGS